MVFRTSLTVVYSPRFGFEFINIEDNENSTMKDSKTLF